MSDVRRGDTVTVPKGTAVYSTHPQWENPTPAGRTYEVEVSYVGHRGIGGEYPGPVTVEWVGSGGYWKWCRESDVERRG